MRAPDAESDFALGLAVDTIEKVRRDESPFERTLRTCETEDVRKEQIEGRIAVNLRTIRRLMAEKKDEFFSGETCPKV